MSDNFHRVSFIQPDDFSFLDKSLPLYKEQGLITRKISVELRSLVEEHDHSHLARLGTDPEHVTLLQHHPQPAPSSSAKFELAAKTETKIHSGNGRTCTRSTS